MRRRYFLICGLITLAALMAGFLLYPHLPERLPSHWNVHGKINGYESRWAAVFLIPGIMAGLIFLFAVLPAPRRMEANTFQSTCMYLMVSIVVTLAYFHGLVLWAAFSPRLPMTRAITGGLCVLWVLVGNVMGKVRRNFWVGIHTPWTMANERVWYATHRFGGWVFVSAGVLGLALAFVLPDPVLVMVLLMAAAFISGAYSFVFYKHLKRQGANL